MTARIFQLNLSDGGVPKTAVRSANITREGIEGDRQRDLKHHGGPLRALCLFSLEQILALQAEGHLIYPGAIGENITFSGLDWLEIKPGKRLTLGESVQIEITSFAVPCRNIQDSFLAHKISRVSEKTNSGWSRAYAKILQPGLVKIGDPVFLAS